MKRAGVLAAVLLVFPAWGAAPKLLKEAERQHMELARRVASAVVAIPQSHPASGVLISPDGHLLTCLEAIPEGARKVKVRLYGGRAAEAKVVKRYPDRQLAVLQVKGSDFAWLPLAEGLPRVGAAVLAVGNTRGVHTVSDQAAVHAGVVSGLIEPEGEVEAGGLERLIETDAGVNPGSFGGALADLEGRLVGILSPLYSERRWLGTAIPIAEIAEDLRKDVPALRKAPASPAAPALLGALDAALRKAAEQAARCVVTVKAERPWKDGGVPRTDVRRRYTMRPEAGTASGVLVDAEGYVLTTYFNVEKADKLTVILPEGRAVEATLAGTDRRRDLALLKIDAKGLPTPEWAPAQGLRVGHWAVVVGRDRPEEPISVSTGIVSALGRFRGDAFETDALVNYGSAGGAVVDDQGRLLGVAARIEPQARHGVNSGVAFAVPGEVIREILPLLKEGQKIPPTPTPFLGIGFRNDEDEMDGVYVDRILPDSGASKSDLKVGDIVVAVDGEEVFTRSDLLEQVRKRKPGDQIQLKVRREEETLTIPVTIGKSTGK